VADKTARKHPSRTTAQNKVRGYFVLHRTPCGVFMAVHGGGGLGALGAASGGSGWPKNGQKITRKSRRAGALADQGELFACNFEGLVGPIEIEH